MTSKHPSWAADAVCPFRKRASIRQHGWSIGGGAASVERAHVHGTAGKHPCFYANSAYGLVFYFAAFALP